MYEGASTANKLGEGESVLFPVGVHQGSELSPSPFIIVLEALSAELRTEVPWELLYADELAALIVESKEKLMDKLSI